ncbi:MAG: hypothetical protein WC455_25320 [Dehalococcoidia bacterium]|jgi:hypothetical protein
MDFPRYVFTSPGPEKIKEGSYGTRLVSDQDEFDSAIKAGFFETMPEAVESTKDKPKSTEIKKADPEADPNPEPEAPKRGRPRSA